MANRLAYFLRLIPAKEVHVDIDQVAELIGAELAVELSIYSTEKSELRKDRVGPRSAIPAAKRVKTTHLAGFNRLQLLEAIEAAKGKDFQVDGTETKTKAQGTPNPALLPGKVKERLQARGLVATAT